MHGFLGCIERDSSSARAMTDWMEKWHAIEPSKRSLEIERSPFRFRQSIETGWDTRPVARSDEGLTLGYCGFISADQFEDQGRHAPTSDTQVAEALLKRYREDGSDSLAGMNGRYVVWVWDSEAGRLELIDDILGLKPVFLWQNGDSFAFSSNIWAIACHPQMGDGIDPQAMVDLLLLNHQQGNRTLLAEVDVLPPGSVAIFQDGELRSRRVVELEFSRERWNWSIEKTARRMHELLNQALERRVPEGSNVLLPLSGGLDSRALLGLLGEHPVDQYAVSQYTHGALGLDTRLAKRLASTAGVRHRAVPLPDDFLSRYRAKSVSINGGMYDLHTGRFLSLFDLSLSEGRPIVSGHLGGELTGRFHIHDSQFSSVDEHFQCAFREENMYRFPRERLERLLRPQFADGLVDATFDECRRSFLDHDGTHWQRFWDWDLLLYRRRYDAYMLLYFEQFHKVIAPFYDRDFADFAFSLPWAALERQRAYCEMHRKSFPRLARVPNSNTERPPRISTRYVLADFVSTQWRRFVRYPLQRVLGVRRWYEHPCEQIGFALSGASKPVLEHILDNLDRISPWLAAEGVRHAVHSQLEGDNVCAMGLLGLSTFVTALEMLEEPRRALSVWER